MFRTKARFLKLNIRAIVQRLGKIDIAKELNFLLLRKGNSLMLRKCNIVNRTLMHSAVSRLLVAIARDAQPRFDDSLLSRAPDKPMS